MQLLRISDQLFRCLWTTIENHILQERAECRFYLLIQYRSGGINNTHIHSLGNGVIEENSVHRLTHSIITPEREGKVTYTTTHLRTGKVPLDPFHRTDEGQAIAIMLLHTGSDRQDIGIKDDVLRVKTYLLRQQVIGPFTDRNLPLKSIGLPLLIKSHDNRGSTQLLNACRMAQEQLLTLFQ